MSKRFTKEEVAEQNRIIKELWHTSMSSDNIAVECGLSGGRSVRTRASQMDLGDKPKNKTPHKRYTNTEIEEQCTFVSENYENMSNKELALALNITEDNVRSRAKKLGLTREFIKYANSTEDWYPIPIKGLQHYEASPEGNVRNSKTNGLMSTSLDKDGYLLVTLTQNGTSQGYKQHRLIALACYDIDDESEVEGLQVNHIDGVKDNNNIDNLEWVTPSENTRHAHRTGLAPSQVGSGNHFSKYTNEQIREVCRLSTTTDMSHPKIAKQTGVKRSTVWEVASGKKWTHISSEFGIQSTKEEK